jgi:hypothetical protein
MIPTLAIAHDRAPAAWRAGACFATHPSVRADESGDRFRHLGWRGLTLGINGKHALVTSARVRDGPLGVGARVLSARALVGKSVLVGPCRLSLSPITSRPWTPPPTIALPGATSPSSRSSWRPSARPDRADRHRGARSDSPNLERPVAAVRTIAFVLPRPYVARSRWRQRDRADPGPNTPRRTFGIAQEQSLGRVRARERVQPKRASSSGIKYPDLPHPR